MRMAALANAYRLRWPCVWCLIFFFWDPRATPAARLALGAAFFRAVRFSFLRSVLSVTVFVFIQFLFNPAYFSTSFLSPKRGKLTVILASSPSPSRLTTVPVPYFG